MTDVRRTFLPELAAAFGEERMSDLRKRIEDLGKPILLKPPATEQELYVSEGGTLFLGARTPDMPRPSWRAFFQRVGALEGRAPEPVERLIDRLGGFELDEPVDDARWSAVYRAAFDPMAAAYHFLRGMKTGPETDERHPENGRIDLLAGFAYSGDDDIWVEVQDDLSVSLLQARLIQLGQPVMIIMEAAAVIRAEAEGVAFTGSDRLDAADRRPDLRLAYSRAGS